MTTRSFTAPTRTSPKMLEKNPLSLGNTAFDALPSRFVRSALIASQQLEADSKPAEAPALQPHPYRPARLEDIYFG